jgi:aminopeptidase-like protein
LKEDIYNLLKTLFPICRSITGNGVRQTLKIIQQVIPLETKEVASGTKVFDWIVPDEWNIEDAYVKDESSKRVIDFKKCNLHIVGYSVPFEGKMSLAKLKEHLYTLPEQPDLIPYVTSYYKKRWGFCLEHNQYKALEEGIYEVKIASSLKPGSLTYGELVIEGRSDKEILLSTYICHPSMANNELSGPALTTYLAKYLLSKKQKPYYSYRVIFIPETIGAITYLSLHKEHLKKNVIAGYVITCTGLAGPFSYIQTRAENTLVDRVTIHVLKYSEKETGLYDFLSRGSDERQYNCPGIDLPVGSLMRIRYGEYPEYHTSGDNLELVTAQALEESLEMYKLCIEVIENNHTYVTTVFGEPQLDKYGLYHAVSTVETGKNTKEANLRDVLAYCDGSHDLLWIADKINCPVWELFALVGSLSGNGLIRKVNHRKYEHHPD